MYIETEKELLKLKNNQKYVFTCKRCGRTSKKSFRKSSLESCEPFLCKKCKTALTCLEKYGVECSFQADSVKNKIKQTVFNHFGVQYCLQSKDIREKGYETNLKKLGVRHPAQSDQTRQKMQNTIFERYGVKHAAQSDSIKNKMKATTIARYGVEHYSSTKNCREQVKKTLQDKYNVNNAHFLYKKIEIDGIQIESSWELAFYLYYRDNGFIIKKCTESFLYEYNGKIHNYYPDFEVNGQFYEIKGDQFFNKNGTMCCPFDSSKNGLFEAKHQCGLKNNVIFISKKEIKPYLEYAKSKYGYKYLGMIFR